MAALLRPSLLALLLLAPVPAVRAQDWELPPDEAADLVELYVDRGRESLREGNHEEARLRLEKALARDPGHRRARLLLAETLRRTGAWEKADAQLAAVLDRDADDREARVARAALDLSRGRRARVETSMRAVIEAGGPAPDLPGLRARVLLADSLAERGRRDDARTVLDYFLDHYRSRFDVLNAAALAADRLRDDPDRARPLSEELTLMAKALRRYVELSPLDYPYIENAFDLVGWATDLDPDNWEAHIEYVRVSRVERERAIGRARKVLQLAEKRNPELAELYVEVAHSVLVGWNGAEARRYARTAIRINPRQADARAILARTYLEDNQYDEARRHLDAGLDVNPDHRDLRALDATLALLRGDEDAFGEGMAGVLALDPTYGQAYHLAALVVASRQRRYDVGVDLLRKGLRIDPGNFDAQATLGVFLANLGRAEEALEVLRESQKALPFSHPVRDNFETVLEYVTDSMTELRTEHFVIRFDPSEYAVMSRFLPDLLERCWADMTERYGFVPEAPVLVEVFKKADDFSVRTLGVPGIPALGACFGGLITLDSPQALPPGQFLWASTARHEFAHVMSLQLSDGQVPRWFTEGLSVLEEIPLDTGWGLDERFEREVYDAYVTSTLPKIAEFDAMFRTSRVAFAYHVGGLMLQFLQERSGEEGIVRALRLYGEDRPMAEVFRKAFDIGLAEFDEEFEKYIATRVARYKLVPNYAPLVLTLKRELRRNPGDTEAMIRLAWGHFQRGQGVDAQAVLARARKAGAGEEPLAVLLDANLQMRAGRPERARARFEAFVEGGGADYHAFMTLAAFASREGEVEDMVAHLRRAKECWPLRAEGENPYTLLAAYYRGVGNTEAYLAELEQQARILSKDIEIRMQLHREYVARDRPDDALRVLDEALRITPFDRRIHEAMLPLLREQGLQKKAVDAAACVVALRAEQDDDEAVAGMYVDLAEVLFEAGRGEEARAALEEAGKLVEAGEFPRLEEVKRKIEGAGQ